MAGIMVWSVDTDDFLGSCGKGRFPLLTSINEALVQHEQSAGGSGGSGATSVGGVSQLQSFILAVIVAAITTRWWNH